MLHGYRQLVAPHRRYQHYKWETGLVPDLWDEVSLPKFLHVGRLRLRGAASTATTATTCPTTPAAMQTLYR